MGARHRAVGRGAAGDDPRRDGAGPDRRIRPDIPQSPEDALTSATRHLPIVVLALVALCVAACGSTAPTAAPSTSATPPAASLVPTASPAPTATVTPTATPSASAAVVSCDLKPQTGALPSDRLTGMQVLGVPG